MYSKPQGSKTAVPAGGYPSRKTPIGKKLASPLKPHCGKLVGRVYQVECSPLPWLGRLFTHDDDDER